MIVYRHYIENCNSHDTEICELLNKVNELVNFIFYVQEYPEYDYGILFRSKINYNYELFKKIIICVDSYSIVKYGFFRIPHIYTKREVCAYLNGIYYGLTFK